MARKTSGPKSKTEKAKRRIENNSNILDDGITIEESADPHLNDLLRLRRKMRGFIKTAEKQYAERPSQSTAYTLLAFYNKYTDLISEIRAIEDQNQFAHVVKEQVLIPAIQNIFQNFSDTLFSTQKVLRETLGDKGYNAIKQRYEGAMMSHGRYLTQVQEMYCVKVDGIFDEKA